MWQRCGAPSACPLLKRAPRLPLFLLLQNNHFPGVARPYEFNGELLLGAGRKEEARDVARIALRLPWWTMHGDVADCKRVALLDGDAKSIMYQLSEEAMSQSSAARGAQLPRDAKGPSQVAMEQAQLLMNQVAAGELGGWDEIRGQLADLYKVAGLLRVADLVATN